MLGFSHPPTVYLYCNVVDFRKSINGLAMIVEQELGRSAFDPALYVFGNKARDKIKCLYWDSTGFALWYKRLEKHRFKWPDRYHTGEMALTHQQFQWLLQGYDIIGHQPVKYSTAG